MFWPIFLETSRLGLFWFGFQFEIEILDPAILPFSVTVFFLPHIDEWVILEPIALYNGLIILTFLGRHFSSCIETPL